MNTKDMQIFIKIADYRSITRTAEDMQMTQPAVSSTLKRLEDELGYELFYRRGNWLVLNEQGKLFYDAACEFMSEMAHVRVGLEIETQPASELTIRICTPVDRIFRLMGEFARDNRDIRIHLIQDDLTDTFRNADLEVTALREDMSLRVPLEHRGAMYAIIHENHRLYERDVLSIEDLREESFVFMSGNAADGLEDAYLSYIRLAGSVEISMVTDTVTGKYSAIRRGCGIGLAYDSSLSMAPLIRDCRTIPIIAGWETQWVYLGSRREQLTEAAERFLGFVKERV